jgi:Ulp1 family protease
MSTQQVTRPIKILIPLIKEDLQQAESAGVPYYRAAGEKLIEAKSQLNHGEWAIWLKKNFQRSQNQAQNYMNLARDSHNPRAQGLSSIRDYQKKRRSTNGKNPSTPTVKTDRAELEASKSLAFKVIDVGYKSLAQEFHPDKKGGSTEAMARLNRVRARLKLYIERSE